MTTNTEWPLWEVFVRTKAGLDHKHCGSLHAADPKMAVQMARDVYTRRQEGSSVWVVRSDQIVASDPGDKDMLFDPAEDKVYRHPTFYKLPLTSIPTVLPPKNCSVVPAAIVTRSPTAMIKASFTA